MSTMKNQLAPISNNQYLKGKAEDSMNSTVSSKTGANKIPKKTLQKYKDIEEELEKLRRETDSQDTRLLKIQNASRRVEEDYQAKKQEVENKLMELSKRNLEFKDKQRKARDALNLEEERVKKTENKKIQEKIRLDESEKKIEELKKEREEKEQLKEDKMKEKQTLESECVELKKFEDFLKEVMKRSPEFFDEAEGADGFNVQNLIAKHERIMNNKKRFEETMEQIDRIKEEEAEEFQKFKKEQEEIIMIKTSSIYTLQEQIEDLNKEKSKVQGEVNRIEHKTNMETSKWSQIIMSISNLYNRAQEAKDMREMEKRKEKEKEQQHLEGNDEKNEKVEKKKKDMRKWDDIRTEDMLNNLVYLEEQIKFLKDIKGRWVERKKAQESKKF